MKLLSIRDNKNQKDREDAIKRARAIELLNEVEKQTVALNTINDEFASALTTQQKIWAEEKEKHAQWRNEAQAEVFELENRRYLALLPVTELKKKVQNEAQALEADKEKFKREQEVFEENKLQLQARLDEVSEREQRVQIDEQSLARRRQGIEMQAESVKQQAQHLTEQLTFFYTTSKKKEEQLAATKTMLEMQEKGLKIREKELSDNKLQLHRDRIALQDAYATLEKAKHGK